MTGAQLRRFRERLGWSQSRLAEALGVHVQTVSKWERGALAIENPKMLRLAMDALLAQNETR